MNLSTFFSFDKMITTTIITVIYYVLLVSVILGGLGTIIAGLNMSFGGSGVAWIGFLVLIIGPVLVRVYCEILIVLFKIWREATIIKGEYFFVEKSATVANNLNVFAFSVE